MSYRKKLENKIRKGRDEIVELEKQLRDANIRISAFEEALKLAPGEEEGEEKRAHPLKGIRKGSKADKARAILRQHKRPMKILDILSNMGEPTTKEKRQALGGILSMYVRRDDIFTRPEPGVFGLKEFKEEEGNDSETSGHLKAL